MHIKPYIFSHLWLFPAGKPAQDLGLPIATWPPGSAEELLRELGKGSTLSLRQGGGRWMENVGWKAIGKPLEHMGFSWDLDS